MEDSVQFNGHNVLVGFSTGKHIFAFNCCQFILSRKFSYLLALSLLFAVASEAAAQEVLGPARVQARASRLQTGLGLPVRLDGQTDPVIWYDAGEWKGAESLMAEPFWRMVQLIDVTVEGALTPVRELCADWASEKPKRAASVVWGAFRGGWFVAICKKTRSDLGWKSIGFVVPGEGIPSGKSIWNYSRSVNWIERNIGYNLFPKLPAHLQEIIEEMTASEILCPYQEFDPGMDEGPDREKDYDREADYREMD